MSIFISELAFEDPAVKAQAKLAILIASTIAGIVGMVVIKAFVGKKV
jgi:Na+/H+ antiporter NhaA